MKKYRKIEKMCDNEQLYFHEHRVQVVFFCLYACIFIVGVGGNLLVLYVILGNKHMRTTINLYLLNLATSDIIMSVFASSMFMGRWRFLGHGDWMCKLTHTSITLSVCVSTFTLAAIAVNRFLAVFYPFRSRNHALTRTIAIIFCLDLAAIIITLPRAVVINNDDIHCKATWSIVSRKVYVSFLKISQFAIPFTIIVICYTSIIIKLRHRCPGRSESMTTEQMKEEAARNKRINKILITVTVLFGICWIPDQLNLVIRELNSRVKCWELSELILYIFHVIAMSSTCYNPFLYGLMNPAFKAEFAKLWSCARENLERENDSGFVEERIRIEECTTDATGLD